MPTPTERPAHLLVADDEESIRWVLERACTQRGHAVTAVASGTAALAALRTQAFDVALIDIRMPDVSGLDVLTRAREERIDTLFIVMTAQNTMANAIEATKRGAYDYLTKPFDLEQVALLIDRALELRRLTRDLERLRGELDERRELLIGRTPAMQEIYKVIGRVAPTDATVLIQGETGTGKELVARTIHHHSDRRGPFVALNCSAIPNELLESELFGYERGAFTGAVERRIGKFEAAAGGTLFLDEIADMPLPRGPLLPPPRRPHPRAPAARAARRHPRADRLLRRQDQPRARNLDRRRHRRRARAADPAPLARQRPRAREHAPPRRRPRPRAHARGGGLCAHRARPTRRSRRAAARSGRARAARPAPRRRPRAAGRRPLRPAHQRGRAPAARARARARRGQSGEGRPDARHQPQHAAQEDHRPRHSAAAAGARPGAVSARLPALYAIVDPLDTGRDPLVLARALLAGGAELLQVRLKGASPAQLLAVATEVVAL